MRLEDSRPSRPIWTTSPDWSRQALLVDPEWNYRFPDRRKDTGDNWKRTRREYEEMLGAAGHVRRLGRYRARQRRMAR